MRISAFIFANLFILILKKNPENPENQYNPE